MSLAHSVSCRYSLFYLYVRVVLVNGLEYLLNVGLVESARWIVLDDMTTLDALRWSRRIRRGCPFFLKKKNFNTRIGYVP